MATISQDIRELDVVKLKRSVGGWPAQRQGTVLEEKDQWRLVEIADSQGVMLDLLSVREEDLDLVWKPGWLRPRS